MPSAIDLPPQETMTDLADRKRPRADNDDTPRKSKKAKETKEGGDSKNKKEKKEKKEKKDKKSKDGKDKKEKKDKKDKKSHTDSTPTPRTVDDIDLSLPSDDPESAVFPFYTQTVSLYVPLFPLGFDKPVTSAANQHLAGLVNHYAPQLGGYLLAYRNVNLSETAARADPRNPPTDETPAVLTSVDEYAVGFGWMTADVDLFVPSRGAWLEGTVILQNEGAIGVSCWDKFNASIEAARLPAGWQYVELEDVEEAPTAAPPNDAMDTEEDGEDGAVQVQAAPTDTESVAPLQATGYWVDADGRPVDGKIRFRIKDFDVGLAGDNGYIAIEGTMLSATEERALKAKERARIARGRESNYIIGQKIRRLPEFSITQFGKEDEEEDSAQKVELYKGSRPGTPDE
ncbi:hypothetical protein Sste5346_006140 [Sporothrix stenoceras]|uniref:DNA-directed RNA polymerase subunit n=1 Tax=Sporothrix stenoceras TaxID=5173 RepID=A0ABR3Z1S7_9PEZI